MPRKADPKPLVQIDHAALGAIIQPIFTEAEGALPLPAEIEFLRVELEKEFTAKLKELITPKWVASKHSAYKVHMKKIKESGATHPAP